MVKGPGESFLNIIINHDEQEVATGKRNVTAAFQNLEFECFSSPYISITCLVKKKNRLHIPATPHTLQLSSRGLHLSCCSLGLLKDIRENVDAMFNQGSYKRLRPLFKYFSRTTLDFQGPATRNIIISQIVQKCTFPVYSNKVLRLELFASPDSLHFPVHLS